MVEEKEDLAWKNKFFKWEFVPSGWHNRGFSLRRSRVNSSLFERVDCVMKLLAIESSSR